MFVIIGDRSRSAARAAENLCLKCWNYSALKYALDDREERHCLRVSEHPQRLRGPVAECTDFRDKSKPTKHDMDKIAWVIEASKREVGFAAGVKFVPPSERRDLERD